jgi:hypothetical protein
MSPESRTDALRSEARPRQTLFREAESFLDSGLFADAKPRNDGEA